MVPQMRLDRKSQSGKVFAIWLAEMLRLHNDHRHTTEEEQNMKPTSILVLGPPGTGKSTLCASIAEIVDPSRVVLIALRAKERESWKYREHGLDVTATVILDDMWRPNLDMYQADGFKSLSMLLLALYRSDEVDAVVLDPLTDAFDLASHAMLAQDEVESPRELDGKNASIAYYGAFRKKCVQIVRDLTILTAAPHPKWVLTAIHTQPVVEENIIDKKATQAKQARGTRFEGDVLPMMEGGYKFDMPGAFAMKLYTRVKTHRTNQPEYLVQVSADPQRFAGLGIAGTIKEKYLPNNLPAILKAIET